MLCMVIDICMYVSESIFEWFPHSSAGSTTRLLNLCLKVGDELDMEPGHSMKGAYR